MYVYLKNNEKSEWNGLIKIQHYSLNANDQLCQLEHRYLSTIARVRLMYVY